MRTIEELRRRAAVAVTTYNVPEPMIAIAVHTLSSIPPPERLPVWAGPLMLAVLTLAETHEPHHDAQCGCCAALRDAVALTAGLLRTEIDLGLGR